MSVRAGTELYSTVVECARWLNVSIAAMDGGSLTVITGTSDSGIGTTANGKCQSLEILNGSIAARGGTGIGNSLEMAARRSF
jgi:hypothetical protein